MSVRHSSTSATIASHCIRPADNRPNASILVVMREAGCYAVAAAAAADGATTGARVVLIAALIIETEAEKRGRRSRGSSLLWTQALRPLYRSNAPAHGEEGN